MLITENSLREEHGIRDAFALITATAVNGVSDTFWVQVNVWWRGHDEPDDLPSENSEESDDVLSYPNLIEALAQVTAIHDTHSLTDVEEVEEIVLNTDNSDFNTNNNQTTVAANSNAPGTTTVFYTYRADGLRRSKTVNGVTTTHVWDGANIVLEQNANGGVINVFTRDARGNLIRSTQHGFYLFNKRGDVVQRVDAQGVVLHTYRYDAFGNEISPDSGNTNRFRFAGEYFDWETGTIYLRARAFNPRTGRFTQPDPHWNIGNAIFGDNLMERNGRLVPCPLAIMQAGNLFVYCINNPIRWTDPTGRIIELAGTAEERRALLAYLQTLTDHRLSINARGRVSISSHATDNIQFAYGNALIERMIASRHVVTISITTGIDVFYFSAAALQTIRGPGSGSGGRIYFNPNNIVYTYTLDAMGYASLVRMPANIVLAHELIHADRAMRGVVFAEYLTANLTVPIQAPRARFSPLRIFSGPTFSSSVIHPNIQLEEWAAIGLGHFGSDDITENMIRREHGLNARASHFGRIN